jgi:glycosyltransferase 2 family protein
MIGFNQNAISIHIKKYWQYYIGFFLLISLIRVVNISQLITIFSTVNFWYLILAALFYCISNFFMAFRLKKVLLHLQHKIVFKSVFFSHMGGILLSDFTPARSGYLSVAYFLKRSEVPYEKGLASISSTYLYDLLFKLGIAIIAIFFLYGNFFNCSHLEFVILIILVIIALIGIYCLLLYPPWFVLQISQKYSIAGKLLCAGVECRKIQKIFPLIIVISFICWIFRGLEWYFVALSLHISKISILDSLFLNPLLTLLSFIPVSPAGIGLQEGGIIGVFSLLGIGSGLALSYALLLRIIEIIVDLMGIKELLK